MDLNKLFYPESIAIVGASKKVGSVGHIYLKQVIRSDYKGNVYPINPQYDEVMGIDCYNTINNIKSEIDLAIIALSKSATINVLEECGKSDVKSAIITTGGFKELGEKGAKQEERIREIAENYNIAILGPNTLGLINREIDLNLNFDLPPLPPKGRVSIISQSGGYGTSIISKLREEGVGLNKWVGIGNRATLDFPDFLEYLANDDSTDVIGIFMEGTEKAKNFCELAGEYSDSKPIVVLKAGQSQEDIVDYLAVTHTGSGAGRASIYQGAFRQYGILSASSVRELVSKLKSLSISKEGGENLGIFTYTAGPSIMTAEFTSDFYEIKQPSNGTIRKMREKMSEPTVVLKNPMDVDGEGFKEKDYKNLLTTFAGDEKYDIIASISTSGLFFPRDTLLELQRKTEKPILHCHISDCFELADMGREDLHKAGVPIFSTAEELSKGLIGLAEYREIKEKMERREPKNSIPIDISHFEHEVLNEYESKRILSKIDFPVVKEKKVSTLEELIEEAERIGFPVVLKVLSREILHKSDIGAVEIGIENKSILQNKWEKMKEKWPDEEFLVQKMVKGGVELIIGRKEDDVFGQIVTLGLGGFFTDIFDLSIRICPCTFTDCLEMVNQLKPQKILDGYRGLKPVNRKAIAKLVERVSRLQPSKSNIKELDLNPVIVKGENLYIADALIRKNNVNVPSK